MQSEKDKRIEEIKNGTTNEQKKKTQASLLIGLIEQIREIALFHDETQKPYIQLPIENHFEIWPLRSTQFKIWASKLFWDNNGRAINSTALNDALSVLEGKACFNGEQYFLYNRVAFIDNTLWYDLTDKEWRVVKITSENWEIVNNPPILFRRYNHHREQKVPTAKGSVSPFLEFVNITKKEERLLLLVYLISCFIPDFPHPIINIYGSQGSAKSTLSKLLREVIDPSLIEVGELSRTPEELIQKLSHHWFICFDNISKIPEWVSNLLCKAVTGAGFSKRQLYSNDEDVICSFKRCIGINGINLVGTNSDLLERSILLELERVSKNDRRQEKELFEEFGEIKSSILGGIFDVLSKTIKLYPTIQLSSMPRMADFVVWGCAISEALNNSKNEFLEAYDQNVKRQNEEVLMENIEAIAIIVFMSDKNNWEGTPSELLDNLKNSASESLNIDTDKDRTFPKSASTLSRRINQLRPNLESVGIKIQRTGKDKKRIICIEKDSKNTVSTVEPPGANKVNNNRSSQALPLVIKKTTAKNKISAEDGRDGISDNLLKIL